MFERILSREPTYFARVMAAQHSADDYDDAETTIRPSDEAKDFMQRLLRKDPELRLSNFDEIKQHQWFDGFDWNALQEKTMPAPIVPSNKDDNNVQSLSSSSDDTTMLSTTLSHHHHRNRV